MRDYTYQCKDYSLLTPVFKKYCVTPLIEFVPWGIPANIITIVSNAFFYLALFFSFQTELLGKGNFIIIPVLLMAYLIGDHLDGAQAKRTGTGSALGEFCDHYLDAFNNGILMLIFFNLFGVNNWILVSSVVILSYLAHVSVFYEQFKTGWLIFEKLGSLEGVLIAAILILASYIDPIFDLMSTEQIFGQTGMELFLILTCFGGLATFVKTVARTPNVRYSLIMFTVLIIVIGIVGGLLFETWTNTVILSLYASLYLGKLMTGHLIDGVERSPGLFTPLFLTVVFFMPDFYSGNTFLVAFIYLAANIIILIYRNFQALGQFWVWVNPKK
jgi:phosphatidylglycerophosphate synthase